jgi:hypothetical protein
MRSTLQQVRNGPRNETSRLRVSRPGDPLEQEAERTSARLGQSSTAPDAVVSRQAADGVALDSSATDSVARGLSSSGQQLSPLERGLMERHIGHDFGRVRIHDDADASESARDLGALAYAVGSDIVFASGQYRPGTESGRRLLAHELTHVAQQAGGEGPLVQRAPDPNASGAVVASNDGVSQELRADVQNTINLWRTQANQSILDTAAWYADNYGQFISLTSSNSTLSWTEGAFFKVFEGAVGWAVGKAASSIAGAMLGAEIGSIAGPPGIIAGFVVGKVAGQIAGEIIASIKGPDQRKALNSAQAGQGVNASSQQFFRQAAEGQGLVTQIFSNAQRNLNSATTEATVFKIREWALQEIAAVKGPPKGDRSLFDRMYAEWVLEHSQGTRFPNPNIHAGEGVDPAQWANAVKNAQQVDGQSVANHLDLFGYQTRGFLSSMGVGTEKGQDMIEACRGASTQDAGRIMGQFDSKTMTFTAGDPDRLAGWLAGRIGWQQDSDPVQPKDVADGKVKVEVTPNLAIFAGPLTGAGQPQGSIAVTYFHVSATVPDRFTFKSSDPMDAGAPPIITERGPKTYSLGKVNP